MCRVRTTWRLATEAKKAHRIVFLKSDINNKIAWHVLTVLQVSLLTPCHVTVFYGYSNQLSTSWYTRPAVGPEMCLWCLYRR